MRTSSTQFKILVSYMVKYGDLSKPAYDTRTRMTTLAHWNRLVDRLNGQPDGEPKTANKWKKVWSDLKNNTKRKYARLQNASNRTQTKMTNLEERVLNCLMDKDMACKSTADQSLSVPGEMQIDVADFDDIPPYSVLEEEALQEEGDVDETSETYETSDPLQPDTSTQAADISNDRVNSEEPEVIELLPGEAEKAYVAKQINTPSGARRINTPLSRRKNATSEFESEENRSPSQRMFPILQRRRRDNSDDDNTSSNTKRSRRHRRRPGHSISTNQLLLKSERQWRSFLREIERCQFKLEMERLRLKEVELQQQAQWQRLFGRFLSVMNQFVDNQN